MLKDQLFTIMAAKFVQQLYCSYVSTVLFLCINCIIIIIIKKGWQFEAGRERLTPYRSEDPNPTTPTHRIKEEKGKTAGDKK